MKQVVEIYWLRCLSCVSVVVIHTITTALNEQASDSPFTKEVLLTMYVPLMFATPAFVFISEFLVSKAYKNTLPPLFLKKRVKLLLFPYIFLGFLYALLKTKEFSLLTLKIAIMNHIVLGGFVAYFILIILQFYLLHVLLHQYLARWNPKIVLSIGLFINLTYLAYFNLTVPSNTPIENYIWNTGFWLPFIGWIFYFLLGYYCGRYYEQLQKRLFRYRATIWLTALASLFIGFIVRYFELYTMDSKRIDNVLYTTSVILLVFYLTKGRKLAPNFVMLINKYSFSIYLLHMIFIETMKFFPIMQTMPVALYIVAMSIVSISGSILLSLLMNQFKWGKYLVGKTYEKM